MSKIISYDQFEKVSNKIKEYVDESILFTQEISNTTVTTFIRTVKEEIYNTLANQYATLDTFLEYSDALSISFQLLQYGENLRFENINSNLDDIYEELTALKKEIYANMSFDAVSMNIQQKDSQYAVNVSEKEISFIEGKNKIGTIVDNEFSIGNVRARESLTLGPFRFIAKDSGHLSLVWYDGGNMVNFDYSYPNVTNSNSTTYTAYLYDYTTEDKVYTIELCATMPNGKTGSWKVYANNNTTLVDSISPEYFECGVCRKSIKWPVSSDNISFRMVHEDGSVGTNTIAHIKLYEGDDAWVDTHNLLSYNNVWDENSRYECTNTGNSQFTTDIYAYLDTDTIYNFTCEVDGNFGNVNGEDTVYMYLCNADNEDVKITLPSNNHAFTVPQSGRWILRFDIMKEGITHSFWNARVSKVGMSYEFLDGDGNEIL